MTNDTVADEQKAPAEGQAESPIGGSEVTEAGDTAKASETKAEDAGSKAPEDTPADAEKESREQKSYNELRAKLSEQGNELNSYRKKYEEIEGTHKMTSEELAAYKKWYDQFYPVMNELYQDEAIRQRIEGGAKPRTITEADAERIAEMKLQEFREQTAYERTVDGWIQSHPDVKGELAKKIYEFLEKNDLNPTPELLETAYVYCTKDKLKEIGAREKELHAKKVSDAAVGGGGASTPGKPGNPIDDLFMAPVSNFYPGPKL
jgi:hypothetical protein